MGQRREPRLSHCSLSRENETADEHDVAGSNDSPSADVRQLRIGGEIQIIDFDDRQAGLAVLSNCEMRRPKTMRCCFKLPFA